MASAVNGALPDGSSAYVVRYPTPDGQQWSKPFSRPRDADQFAHVVEFDRTQGTSIAAVSLWIAEKTNPKQVAVRAGHTSVSVVLDRYGHLYPQQDEELIDALEARALAAR